MKIAIILGFAGLVASMASAQVQPQPTGGDPRIQAVDYQADQVVRIEAAVGFQVSVKLAPDEQVESIAVGDSSAWTAIASKAGNLLFVKPLQAGVATNMTVITDVRTYVFELEGATTAGPSMPYTVQFRYPLAIVDRGPPQTSQQKGGEVVGRYKLRGDRTLRPKAISDDGVRTFIEWPAEAALPATYIRREKGVESLANGNMRDGLFVIDSVERQLVFRIDERVARADRYLLDQR